MTVAKQLQTTINKNFKQLHNVQTTSKQLQTTLRNTKQFEVHLLLIRSWG